MTSINTVDHRVIDLEENTAVAAIRFNGKTYALGFRIVEGKPEANTKQFAWLARIFKNKGLELVG